MKFSWIALLIMTTQLNAQTALNFNKRFVESEDRWVAFPKSDDGKYRFGFIYIDPQAGLTFNHEGYFDILPSGEFKVDKPENYGLKVRLSPNNVLVAFIPEDKFGELKIPTVPEWLAAYKGDSNSVQRLYNWGYNYNAWNMCEKALTYLERAYALDPEFKSLAVEMAFSYNCLGRYPDAIKVLESALQKSPKDAYVHKELIYAQMKSGRLDLASESLKTSLEQSDANTYHKENCYNVLYTAFKMKNKEVFNRWLAETKKWTEGDERLTKSIALMEKEI